MQQLCHYVGNMKLEACVDLLQDGMTSSLKMERQLLHMVNILYRYRPFLPPGIFSDLDACPEARTSADGAVDNPLVDELAGSPTPGAHCSAYCGAQALP